MQYTMLHTANHYEVWSRFLSLNTKAIIEIGCFQGKSTQVLHRLAPNAQIYCIDPFEKNKTAAGLEETMMPSLQKSIFLDNIKDFADKVFLIEDFSFNALPSLSNIHPDIIYIDGDHSYKSVCKDIQTCLSLFPEAILIGDDIILPDVRKAVEVSFKKNNRKVCIEKEVWYSTPIERQDTIHILSCVTGNHLKYLYFQIENLLQYSQNLLHIHIFEANVYSNFYRSMTGISFNQKNNLIKHFQNRASITFYDTTKRIVEYVDVRNKNIDGHFSVAAVLRLLAPEVLLHLSSILYFDSDVYAKKSFSLEDLTFAAPIFEVAGVENNFEDGLYINSGVLLMDLDRMRQIGNYKLALKRLNGHEYSGWELEYPDQDVINMYLEKVQLPREYNWMNRKMKKGDPGCPPEVIFEHLYGQDLKIDSPSNEKYREFYLKIKEGIHEYCPHLR